MYSTVCVLLRGVGKLPLVGRAQIKSDLALHALHKVKVQKWVFFEGYRRSKLHDAPDKQIITHLQACRKSETRVRE